jgi:hypothetical protein
MAISFGTNHSSPWAWQGTTSANGAAPSLPSGMVTFLFTDIEGSTRILDQLPEDAPGLLRLPDLGAVVDLVPPDSGCLRVRGVSWVTP